MLEDMKFSTQQNASKYLGLGLLRHEMLRTPGFAGLPTDSLALFPQEKKNHILKPPDTNSLMK